MAIVLWCERKVAANFENKYSFSRSLCFAARARSKICRCFGIELIKKWPIDSNVPIFKNRKQMKNHSTLIHSLGWGSTADKPCVCIPMFLSPNSRVFSPFSTNLLYCKYILLKKSAYFVSSIYIYSLSLPLSLIPYHHLFLSLTLSTYICIFPISTFISFSISPPFGFFSSLTTSMYLLSCHLFAYLYILLLSNYSILNTYIFFCFICLSIFIIFSSLTTVYLYLLLFHLSFYIYHLLLSNYSILISSFVSFVFLYLPSSPL